MLLNKIDGKWDKEKELEQILELELSKFDISAIGFEYDEIDELKKELAEFELEQAADDDEFDVQTEYNKIQQPLTNKGDIWICGRHRIICGDSKNSVDIEKLMNGETADLLITDPPYNVNYGDKAEALEKTLGKGHRNTSRIENDNMSSESFYHFLYETLKQGFDVMRLGAAAYIFHSENEGINFRRAFCGAGFKQAQCLIWEKNTFVLGRQDYQWRHEPILYGWKEGAAHYFINDRTQDTVIVDDEIEFEKMTKQELLAFINKQIKLYKNTTSVIYENKPQRNNEHPTMKPVSLIGKLMLNSSRQGWNVLDLFGGSGSTLIAAEQLGRNAFIIEIDEKYVDVEVKRYIDYVGSSEDVFKITPDGKKVKY